MDDKLVARIIELTEALREIRDFVFAYEDYDHKKGDTFDAKKASGASFDNAYNLGVNAGENLLADDIKGILKGRNLKDI